MIGPYDTAWLDSLFADFWAGITVALTLIPQGLAYAQLANLPPINGLYAAIIPSACYTFFGSSLQLAVGPVAVISLLTGELVAQNVPDYATNPDAAVNFAGIVALCMGITLVVLSLVNAGKIIKYVNHPVMSGFTSGAACLIGLNQIKAAFGFGNTHGHPLPIEIKDALGSHATLGVFESPGPDKLPWQTVVVNGIPRAGTAEQAPQLGDHGYDYAYQVMKWFNDNWNVVYPKWTGSDINPHVPHDFPGHPPPYAGTAPTYVPPTPAQRDLDYYYLQGCKVLRAQMYSGQSIRNSLATKICWITFTILIVIALLKSSFKSNKKRAKSYVFKIWQTLASLSSFMAIIICAGIAWRVKKDDHYPDNDSYLDPSMTGVQFRYPHNYEAYTLKVVGKIDIAKTFFRIPDVKDIGKIYWHTIELTLIAFMESYAVARKIALQNNQLHLLNANQEMWANGAANLLGCVSSAFPVAGSFSRSSLNQASGAKTPFSKVTTMIVVVIAVTSLTQTFEFIPNAALAAVIFVAISNLFGFRDFWEAFKHSKKDFITMLATCILVITFDTSIGLVSGLAISFLFYVYDISISKDSDPVHLQTAATNDGVDVLLLHGDLTFLTADRVKDTVTLLSNVALTETKDEDFPSCSERIFSKVTTKLDNILLEDKPTVSKLPKEIVHVIKMDGVRIIDMTALDVLVEIKKDCQSKNIKLSFVNIDSKIESRMVHYGIIAAAAETKLGDVPVVIAEEGLNPNGKSLYIEVSSAEVDDTNGDISLVNAKVNDEV